MCVVILIGIHKLILSSLKYLYIFCSIPSIQLYYISLNQSFNLSILYHLIYNHVVSIYYSVVGSVGICRFGPGGGECCCHSLRIQGKYKLGRLIKQIDRWGLFHPTHNECMVLQLHILTCSLFRIYIFIQSIQSIQYSHSNSNFLLSSSLS